MPNIKTVKHIVLGEEVTFQIKVNSKGKFSTSHPKVITERCDIWGYEEFSTIDEVLKEIERVVKDVNTQNEKLEYLIAYYVETRNTPERWTENHHKFQLIWTIYEKQTIGKQVTHRYIGYDTFGSRARGDKGETTTYKNDLPVPRYYVLGNEYRGWGNPHEQNRPVADPENDETMPFTPENLAFFISIGTQLKELNDRINDFLEPESIQKFIASNMPMQLVGKVEETAEAAAE